MKDSKSLLLLLLLLLMLLLLLPGVNLRVGGQGVGGVPFSQSPQTP